MGPSPAEFNLLTIVQADFHRLILFPMAKFFYWSKLKACADVKINLTETVKFVLESIENIVEKGENVRYQHFPLFMPPHREIGGILFYCCPSIRLSVCTNLT